MVVWFKTLTVLTATTGVGLEKCKRQDVYDVFMHIFPGIGEIGISMVREGLTRKIYEQFPDLKDYMEQVGPPDPNSNSFDEWIESLEAAFPDGFKIEGGLK
jgi:hypothetical protein